jgi:hypothetical protein
MINVLTISKHPTRVICFMRTIDNDLELSSRGLLIRDWFEYTNAKFLVRTWFYNRYLIHSFLNFFKVIHVTNIRLMNSPVWFYRNGSYDMIQISSIGRYRPNHKHFRAQ